MRSLTFMHASSMQPYGDATETQVACLSSPLPGRGELSSLQCAPPTRVHGREATVNAAGTPRRNGAPAATTRSVHLRLPSDTEKARDTTPPILSP